MSDPKKRLKALIAEENRRSKDPCILFEPLPTQDKFLRSRASIRVLRGGNRSGKSITSYLEMARAARGIDPNGKFPTNRPLLIYVIGYDADTIGRVAYRNLFKPGCGGLLRVIKDKETGQWRNFRPWDSADVERHAESEIAPPLIPPEIIDQDGWAWENKAERVFSVCRLKFGPNHPMNGTEIRAFGSKSEPAMGDPVDIVVIDEDIDNEAWATEMEARLSDRKGKMWWSAFPLLKNSALMRLSKRAEEQKDRDTPDVAEFKLRYSDNPYIDENEKRKRIEGWTEEERQARDFGEYAMDSILMFPEFSRERHGLPRNGAIEPDALEAIVQNGVIPPDWTRYMTVDPGHTTCAVLFAAVPPPEFGDYVVIYDELYIKNCTARIFAERVREKTKGHSFHAFIIDDHGSRITQAGSGVTIRYQYSQELAAQGVYSEMTDSGFIRGSDNVEGRNSIVRSWMQERPLFGPKLRIVCAKCPNLVTEFSLYKKRVAYGKNATDKPVAKDNHACDALGYLAAYKPYYVEQPNPKVFSPVFEHYKSYWMNKDQRDGSVRLGPSASFN